MTHDQTRTCTLLPPPEKKHKKVRSRRPFPSFQNTFQQFDKGGEKKGNPAQIRYDVNERECDTNVNEL
jgi:hypothetical protein